MDLVSSHPYWPLKSGMLTVFPPLEGDQRCDIAVLGAGITGAMAAEALSADGHSVIVLDSRDVATGSTSASTALLQYEIDTHLTDLIDMHGTVRAEGAYRACHESIDLLERKIADLGLDDCGFERKDSIYLASHRRHEPRLQEEEKARRQIGIDVTYWPSSVVRERFAHWKHGALYSTQAAEVDPYRLTHGLLRVLHGRGGKIFDRTRVERIDIDKAGALLRTDRKFSVRASRVVVAMGYETETLFDTASYVKLRSSYALATEPIQGEEPWWHRCLLWETARPYFYLRGEADGRLLCGGFDKPFRNPVARDALIPLQQSKLEKQLAKILPETRLETTCAWAGTFGETKDGLGYIGPCRKHPLCLFALGFGGNGITYSVIAAEILRHQVRGLSHPYADVFEFNRT